ncbi:Uncharacterized protein SCF082_LOCUS46469 [Durusdinium trenchii]|uniref:Uncharacterized protein n=1 Tax=Durusdinium trenchii TaxID=1381693 RepID=A0ABP0RIY4_9DINO
MEFLRILDEYRLKCEDEGNYAEAERASKQLDNLRKQEMKRQVKALKARQISERQDIQVAHNMQFAEFNSAWDKYLDDYDRMAQEYIKQMTERHAKELRDFQEEMHQKMVAKPPKFSKELLEWRRRQHMLAKSKQYAEAQKVKKIADMMESKERSKMDNDYESTFSAKEAKVRSQQQAELNALLKRIDVRRKEHLAQRSLDSKRLLQRNRNVQSVLASKQSVEERVARNEIKTRLSRPRNGLFGSNPAPAQPSKASSSPKRLANTSDAAAAVSTPDAADDNFFLTGDGRYGTRAGDTAGSGRGGWCALSRLRRRGARGAQPAREMMLRTWSNAVRGRGVAGGSVGRGQGLGWSAARASASERSNLAALRRQEDGIVRPGSGGVLQSSWAEYRRGFKGRVSAKKKAWMKREGLWSDSPPTVSPDPEIFEAQQRVFGYHAHNSGGKERRKAKTAEKSSNRRAWISR